MGTNTNFENETMQSLLRDSEIIDKDSMEACTVIACNSATVCDEIPDAGTISYVEHQTIKSLVKTRRMLNGNPNDRSCQQNLE